MDSIDRFIQDNKESDLYAKACIAHVLLQLEKYAAHQASHATARDSSPKDGLIFDIAPLNAYRKLWNAFAQSEDLLVELKKHRFVTFNYDRIFEYFLFVSITNTYDMPHIEVINFVNKLNITHVYGSLGEFEGESLHQYTQKVEGDDSNYGPSNLSFEKAIDSLDLVLNDRKENKKSEQVTKHFKDTEKVVVLGFGFDQTNCEYLRNCYLPTIADTIYSDDPNEYMKMNWSVCMYQKKGACLNRARNLFRVGYPGYSKSIGDYNDHDADFLEHNVL